MKGNPAKVEPAIVRLAIAKADSRQAVYSQCVIYSYRLTGRMDCGFTNIDLQTWIDQNASDLFDGKGKKVERDGP